MANLIIRNPTERQLAEARLIASLKTDPHAHEKMDTSISKRMLDKRLREKPVRPRDLCLMKFIPWDDIAKKLSSLNKTLTYTSLPDAKVGIGFKTPSRVEVTAWEKAILSPSEREEVKRYGNHQGPRPFLVAASRGFVSPYTRILTSSFPTQIVCRSLKGILRVLIAHGAFTWLDAERAFGFRLLGPGTEEKTERLNVTPISWATDRPTCKVD